MMQSRVRRAGDADHMRAGQTRVSTMDVDNEADVPDDLEMSDEEGVRVLCARAASRFRWVGLTDA